MLEQCIIGLAGARLTAREREWLRRRPPLGVILFARNIVSPAQVRELLDEVRSCAGKALWAAIDEEGGRVHRMPWAPFSGRRQALAYGRWFERDAEAARAAAFEDAREAGRALKRLGFTHNCAPVLDVFSPAGDAVIGARAYSDRVDVVAELATEVMRGYREAGIEAVGKHFPGHGRADADSHLAVPHVRAELPLLLHEAEPFARLIAEGLQHVMTAHVIYDAVERRVATLSRFWLQQVLRTRMGFAGKIWSDDLCMRGVGEDVLGAAEEAKAAGCDVLLVCQPEGTEALYSACT
ncbi:MAG: beta-N-acetylhexosaminidase [Zetaproteobacteria bacterium]|nr:MAG: beta-N-acetylhexosaminidase [Zetaproteobacteria bacterium]